MSFRVRAIVLYPFDSQDPRVLRLQPEGLSVVTGDPGRGKSSLIDIIDYCLGSSRCRVSGGRVREATSWFGLDLDAEGRRWFVARRAPAPGRQTTEDFFIAPLEVQGGEVDPPSYSLVREGGVNLEGAIEFLSDLLDIPRLELLEDIGLPAYRIGIRQAARFLFQKQYELTNPTWLFHNQSQMETIEIRRVLPYFLGVYGADDVMAAQRLAALRQRLRRVRERLAELDAIVGGREFTRIRGLLAEAQSVGLTVPTLEAESREEAVAVLRRVAVPRAESVIEQYTEAEELSVRRLAELLEEQAGLRWQYAAAKEKASDIRALSHAHASFRNEAEAQTSRLSSLGIVPPLPSDSARCPVCGQGLAEDTPLASRMREELVALRTKLEEFAAEPRQLAVTASSVEDDAEAVRGRLAQVASEIASIERARTRLEEAPAPREAQLAVRARIDFFLESIAEYDAAEGLRTEVAALVAEIAELEARFSDDSFQERLDDATGQLSADMQYLASQLDFEYRNASIRLDVRRATVLVDRRDSVLSLAEIGGGENVELAHVLAHLALHRHFARHGASVPRILVIDQPSQVYFPSEASYERHALGVRSGDSAKAVALVRLLAEASAEYGFQVLLTEHADFDERWYQAAKVEPSWVDGRGLIPASWSSR